MSTKKVTGIVLACVVFAVLATVTITMSLLPVTDECEANLEDARESLASADERIVELEQALADSKQDGNTCIRWLELEIPLLEMVVTDSEETYDAEVIREWERALEEVGSATLVDAYDEYMAAITDYMYSDTPEYMWEQEWQEVEAKMLTFFAVYVVELRAYLDSRQVD